MYRVELSQNAKKQLSKLSAQVQYRVYSVLKRIQIRPYSYVEKVIDTPYYRLRVGDYRVIMDIKDDVLFTIFFISIFNQYNINERVYKYCFKHKSTGHPHLRYINSPLALKAWIRLL